MKWGRVRFEWGRKRRETDCNGLSCQHLATLRHSLRTATILKKQLTDFRRRFPRISMIHFAPRLLIVYHHILPRRCKEIVKNSSLGTRLSYAETPNVAKHCSKLNTRCIRIHTECDRISSYKRAIVVYSSLSGANQIHRTQNLAFSQPSHWVLRVRRL